jgi:hypothetical protein
MDVVCNAPRGEAGNELDALRVILTVKVEVRVVGGCCCVWHDCGYKRSSLVRAGEAEKQSEGTTAQERGSSCEEERSRGGDRVWEIDRRPRSHRLVRLSVEFCECIGDELARGAVRAGAAEQGVLT